MPWPTMSDYQEVIQHPQSCFSDPELQCGKPTLDRLGLPRPITGGFASVYPLLCNGRKWAVRCFLREFQDHQSRYEALSRHLQGCRSPYKVDFAFQPKGIRVHGQWYPILKMEWIEGKPLNVHVESLLGNNPALQTLAHSWCALIKDLRKNEIAHGDLQHGNVLIVHGSYKLIDYDGMYVPALRGVGGHETGHPSYQHPRRSGNDFGPHIDNFAALAIYVALLALSEQPLLWSQFDNGDNILFLHDDFLKPSHSQVFAALRRLKNQDTVKLVTALQAACTQNVDQVPQIEALAHARVPQEDIVICTQCGQKNSINPAMIAPRRIWRCGKCGHGLRTVQPEWVQEWLHTGQGQAPSQLHWWVHTGQGQAPGGRPGLDSSWFHFVLAWKRPEVKIEKQTRDEPIYENRQRQVQIGEEPIYENRTRQVEKKILWGLLGTRFVSEIDTVQTGTRPIMRTETYRVQTGTRPIMRTETYRVQTGTRPIVEEKLRRIRGHSAPKNAVCFSGDGLRVLSTGDDCSIFTWDCTNGNELQSIPQVHNQKISGITLQRRLTCPCACPHA